VIVIDKLTGLIRQYAGESNVTLLGVGAGPGRHMQSAIVASGIDPSRVTAYLVDLDDDAFDYGRNLARELHIAASVHFIQGDARRIRETLPDIAAHVVKLVGIVEYLNDEQFLDLLAVLRDVMVPQGTLLTHGLIDAYGIRRFLARVFNLRHHRRNAEQMQSLLRAAGFRTTSCEMEPARVHPILTAVVA
jgi:cyclopropane fatty-acyl-phospholipid synthase-like methyltransferase